MKEPKLKTVYVCSNCWRRQAPAGWAAAKLRQLEHDERGALYRKPPKQVLPQPNRRQPLARKGWTTLTAKRLSEISMTEEKSRILTGISELDRYSAAALCWAALCF